MRRATRLIAPFGFYGWGNTGDESTLQGFGRLVAPYRRAIRVWVASRNPAHTGRVEPAFRYYAAEGRDLRGRWARYRADAHVVVGGTPIMDVLGAWPLSEVAPLVERATDDGKPVMFVGVGTERLGRDESRRVVAERLAPRVRRWSVRSARDRDRLVEYGVDPGRILVAADLAWLLAGVSSDHGRECLRGLGLDPAASYVGVNVNAEEFVVAQQPKLFEAMAEALDAMIEEHGVRVLFLANEIREDETFDKAASQKVLARMRHRDRAVLVPNLYRTPQEMQSLISCCRVTISMRYHFCLFSALQGVPFVAVKRSDKVDDLCWDLEWPYGLALSDVSGHAIAKQIGDLVANRGKAIEELNEHIGVMRQRAQRNGDLLDELLGRRPAPVGGP